MGSGYETLYESITIDASSTEDLARFDCLSCILEVADIEVDVRIEAHWDSGYESTWSDPGSGPSSNIESLEIIKWKIVPFENVEEQTILFLMTKEQKKALQDLVDYIADKNLKNYLR